MSSRSESKLMRWWRSPRMLLRQILMLDDTPHSIALGTAIGMFIGLTPTPGIQMALVLITAGLTGWLFRFNRVAAIIMVYISNPVTSPPLYWLSYKVGTLFVEGDATYEQLVSALVPQTPQSWWNAILDLCVSIGWPLVVGSLVVATISGIVTYPVMLWLVRRFQSPKTPAVPQEERELVGSAAD